MSRSGWQRCMYTSGTTGRQKGVELHPRLLALRGEAIDEMKLLDAGRPPVSSGFRSRTASARCSSRRRCTSGFRRPWTGASRSWWRTSERSSPRSSPAVPRVFEKVHSKVVVGAQERGGLKLKIFNWAFDVGPARVDAACGRASSRRGCWRCSTASRRSSCSPSCGHASAGRLRFFISGASALSQRGRRVVPRGEHPHCRGLRPHGDQRGHLRQPASQLQVRDRRARRCRAPR